MVGAVALAPALLIVVLAKGKYTYYTTTSNLHACSSCMYRWYGRRGWCCVPVMVRASAGHACSSCITGTAVRPCTCRRSPEVAAAEHHSTGHACTADGCELRARDLRRRRTIDASHSRSGSHRWIRRLYLSLCREGECACMQGSVWSEMQV